MRIFRGWKIENAGWKTISILYSLLSILYLSACHDTIEYYKRGESYASEKINGEVNNVLDCDEANKDKSYCDDSATNREKQHQTEIANQEVINQARKAEAKIQPSQTPMQVSKGPIPPEPETLQGQELKPVQPGGAVITPLTPVEKVTVPVVKKPEALAKKKPVSKKTTKKKPVKKSVKKKPVKKAVKKTVQKPVEKPKETGGAGGNQGVAPNTEGPVVDKPLLPKTTDDMLGIDKISP